MIVDTPQHEGNELNRIKKGVPLSSTLLLLLWGVNYRDICIIVTDVLPAFVARTIYVPGASEDASYVCVLLSCATV